jgi:hypothetical protein
MFLEVTHSRTDQVLFVRTLESKHEVQVAIGEGS